MHLAGTVSDWLQRLLRFSDWSITAHSSFREPVRSS